MDLAFFLAQWLDFVEFYYNAARVPFEETCRKIEAGEPPYEDFRDPEFAEEPAYFEEWELANTGLAFVGASCLDIIQASFHTFLNRYMKHIGNEHVIPRLREMKQEGWFNNYRAFFQEYLHIDWANSGADLELIEQVILARHDFTHNIDLVSLNAFQQVSHGKKYPASPFLDPAWRGAGTNRKRLIVPPEELRRAIEALRDLSKYLDDARFKN